MNLRGPWINRDFCRLWSQIVIGPPTNTLKSNRSTFLKSSSRRDLSKFKHRKRRKYSSSSSSSPSLSSLKRSRKSKKSKNSHKKRRHWSPSFSSSDSIKDCGRFVLHWKKAIQYIHHSCVMISTDNTTVVLTLVLLNKLRSHTHF